jgi:hypothetical protein
VRIRSCVSLLQFVWVYRNCIQILVFPSFFHLANIFYKRCTNYWSFCWQDILVFWLWGWDWRLAELRPLLRAYCSSPDEGEWVNEWMNEWMSEWKNYFYFFNFRKCGAHCGIILTGENRRTRRKKILSQCQFVYHKSHWIDPVANPGRCVERAATNLLSHGTAFDKTK